MSQTETVANFNDMNGLHSQLYETAAVPLMLWTTLQNVQRESLRAVLPKSEWEDRVDVIVQAGDIYAYREGRINPNSLVGKAFQPHQLFRSPLIAVTYDSRGEVISGVLTANNTSGTHELPGSLPTPNILHWLEAEAKMLMPPGLDVPIIGGRRYVHVREVYTMPGVQTEVDSDADIAVVSGITLHGLWHSLTARNPQQELAAHVAEGDPADHAMFALTNLLAMHETGRKPNTIPGYLKDTPLVRMQGGVHDALTIVDELPDARAMRKVATSMIRK